MFRKTGFRFLGCCLLMLCGTELFAAEYTSRIDVLKGGERWWGVFVAGGRAMPFEAPFPKTDLATWSDGQTTPFLVSSRGRYIWSAEPFAIEYTGESFLITSPKEEVKAVTAGKSLREAYLICCHKNFPPTGKTPALDLFTRPVYDTRLELGFDPTAEGLRQYADRLLETGFPAGTLLMGAGWQSSVGSFEPDPGRYGDFGALIKDLHAKGFKVMLTVTPYVSSDGPTFRTYRGSSLFVRQTDGTPATVAWEGGYSALYDLTDDHARTLLQGWLEGLCSRYGVDGYFFDGREALSAMHYVAGGPSNYLEAWSRLGERYDFCEYSFSRRRGFEPYIHNLTLKGPIDADILKRACAEMIDANLLGYPYTVVLPAIDSLAPAATKDLTMQLRAVQLASILPVMQIPFAPWKLTDASLVEALKEMANRRVQMASYYETLVKESARTAEPLLRHMEYEFPRNGFTDCNDQFMLGSKYLVAPLLGEGASRMVRFPRGNWIDLDGKRYRGPLVTTIASKNGSPLVFQSVK